MNALGYMRRQRGLTVRELHKATGLAETTIYRAESASEVSKVNVPTLKALMDFYGANLGYLIALERDVLGEERAA